MGREEEETGGTGAEALTPGGMTEGRDERPKLVAKWNVDLWCKVLVVVVVGVAGKRVVRLIPGVGWLTKRPKPGGGEIGGCVPLFLFCEGPIGMGTVGLFI